MKILYKKKNNLPENTYFIYGKHPALGALENPNRKIIEIYCIEKIFLENRLIISKFPYKILSQEEMDVLIGQNNNHQGLAVKVAKLDEVSLESIDLAKEKSVILILDQITDPQNVGSIIRNAAAFGVDAIITTKVNSILESSLICKVSAGAVEKIKLIKVSNIINSIEFLKRNQYWVVGLDGYAEQTIQQKYLKGKIVFILGSEGEGLRKLVKENADFLYKIPIASVESLNVSSASAIALYSYYLANE
jgi:23S rRNA (guanosine2251-2'-O)-methyltransferase